MASLKERGAEFFGAPAVDGYLVSGGKVIYNEQLTVGEAVPPGGMVELRARLRGGVNGGAAAVGNCRLLLPPPPRR